MSVYEFPMVFSRGRRLTHGTRLSQRRRAGDTPAGGGHHRIVAHREGADGSHLRLASGRAGNHRVHVRFHRFRAEWGRAAPARAAGSQDRRYRGSGRFSVHDVVRDGRRRRARGDLRQRPVRAGGDCARRQDPLVREHRRLVPRCAGRWRPFTAAWTEPGSGLAARARRSRPGRSPARPSWRASPSSVDDRAGMFFELDYYANPGRGAVPEWKNEMAEMSWFLWLTFDGVRWAVEVSVPTLMGQHSDGCVFPEHAKAVHAALRGPKQIEWTAWGARLTSTTRRAK